MVKVENNENLKKEIDNEIEQDLGEQDTKTKELLYDIFKVDHDLILNYIEKVNKGRKKKMEYFDELLVLVLSHQDAEEKCLFDNTPTKSSLQRYKRKMVATHEVIRKQFQIILDTYEDDDMWSARFEVLESIITYHLDEEKNDIFKCFEESSENLDFEMIRCMYKEETKLRNEYHKINLDKGVILNEKDIVEPGSIGKLRKKHE